MHTHNRSVYRWVGMLALAGWQTASAVDVSWYRQLGSATQIASNASASLWMIGTDSNVHKWNGKHFVNQNYSAARIAVTTTDKLWMIDQYGLRNADPALYLSQQAQEVAVGPDNSAWIIGIDQRPGGYGVYQKPPGISGTFAYANFGAVRIAVDKTGSPWVVNESGDVYVYNVAARSWARKGTIKARSVHTGALSGSVWMLGVTAIPGGFPIYQWNATKQDWEPYGTFGAVDMTETGGVPWIVQKGGNLYSKIDLTTMTIPTTVGSITWPTPTPQAQPPLPAIHSGKLLCSGTAYADCGNTRAD